MSETEENFKTPETTCKIMYAYVRLCMKMIHTFLSYPQYIYGPTKLRTIGLDKC